MNFEGLTEEKEKKGKKEEKKRKGRRKGNRSEKERNYYYFVYLLNIGPYDRQKSPPKTGVGRKIFPCGHNIYPCGSVDLSSLHESLTQPLS